jgi:hypothetical protein
MSATERPAPEEIVLYDKDPETKIATITFNRPEYLNAPTSAARLRYADLAAGPICPTSSRARRRTGSPSYESTTQPSRIRPRNRFGMAPRWDSGMRTSRQATARSRS